MNSSKKTEVIIHFLVWGIIFCIPFLFFSSDSPRSSRILFKTWTPILFSAILFYINYFFLVKKFLLQKQLSVFLIINLLLISLFIVGLDWLQDLFFEQSGRRKGRRNQEFKYYAMLRYSFTYILTIAVSVAFRVLKEKQLKEKKQNEQLSSELEHLKYQIQPHFFLNTLNNIYALTDISTEKAKETIHGLSKLMRYLLYQTKDEKVELHQEIEFLEKYIELMCIRLNESVEVNATFHPHNSTVKVAPLLFIPLVENAFKHGVSASNPSEINIDLALVDHKLIFRVENTNFAKDKSDKGGSGIGLSNLKKRLTILYPNSHHFSRREENGKFIALLEIKL